MLIENVDDLTPYNDTENVSKNSKDESNQVAAFDLTM